MWTVKNKVRNRTGYVTRMVPLNDLALELAERLIRKHPTGPIFRNTRGTKWNRFSVAHRMRAIADRLGIGQEACVYALRHLFVTNALETLDISTVAAIVGHTDTKMIMRVYSHVHKRKKFLVDSVNKVNNPLSK